MRISMVLACGALLLGCGDDDTTDGDATSGGSTSTSTTSSTSSSSGATSTSTDSTTDDGTTTTSSSTGSSSDTTGSTTDASTGSSGSTSSTGDPIACTWEGDLLVEGDIDDVTGFPRVAVDADGNVFAVWTQGGQIAGNRYDAIGGLWGTDVPISTAGAQDFPADPRIAAANGDSVFAVWDVTGISEGIYAARYDAGSPGWETQALISNGGNGADPTVVVDGSGNAIAVWSQNTDVFANRYDASGASWGTAASIDDSTLAAQAPQIGIDDAGNAIAVWAQGIAGSRDIYANRFDVGGTAWDTAETIDTGVADAREPDVAVDDDGNAVAIWLQGAAGSEDVYVAHYDATGSAWGSDANIESSAEPTTRPRVGIDDDGNAIAAWRQADGAGNIDYVAAVYDAVGTSWGPPAPLNSADSTVRSPRVAMAGNGTAIAVWRQDDGVADSTWSACWDGVGWSSAVPLETGAAAVTNPEAAINDSGLGAAIWVDANADAFANLHIPE